jgi:hypothetical protein
MEEGRGSGSALTHEAHRACLIAQPVGNQDD